MRLVQAGGDLDGDALDGGGAKGADRHLGENGDNLVTVRYGAGSFC
ncbi:hypothetical protein [Aeromonas salmonicida]|nr:hypothetical protein [Aeromonas salmonicida]WCH25194.1 hypothetical protein ONZ54_22740 [Aeromonas salmonicida]